MRERLGISGGPCADGGREPGKARPQGSGCPQGGPTRTAAPGEEAAEGGGGAASPDLRARPGEGSTAGCAPRQGGHRVWGEGGSGGAASGALPPTCCGSAAGLLPVGGHGPPVGAPAATRGGGRSHPAAGPTGLGSAGQGAWRGRPPGQGSPPRARVVGQRPPGPGCEARPSVAATINMFVQGKPGWGCARGPGGEEKAACASHTGPIVRAHATAAPWPERSDAPRAPAPAPSCGAPPSASPLGLGSGREGAGLPGEGRREEEPGRASACGPGAGDWGAGTSWRAPLAGGASRRGGGGWLPGGSGGTDHGVCRPG